MKSTDGLFVFLNRLAMGLLFLIPGIYKVFMPGDFIGFLMEGPFPAAVITPVFWVVTIFEIIAAVFLLVGYKVKWVGPPLAGILLVALGTVVITDTTSKVLLISILFHLAGAIICAGFWFSGPGKWAVDKA